ncbi:hypothetical protein [Bacillus sp. SG-1]|uniref:hypothetical protein n=1 Tax=Bacillus sp. SG-1 TaxID=161544 RepID=UPI000154335A|nr:hypothetical protein [Bacillus sp. SG-1]EDL66290.1 hypothetical protein BSG1_03020 [Bacillus sp. SG-1]
MKDEHFSKLFDEVDKNEETSIEFDTIWRKANRRRWLDKYFHSLKHNLAILCTLLILAPVIGSFILNSPSLDQSSKEAAFHHKQYVIEGETIRTEEKAVLKGESALPHGSVLQAKLVKDDLKTVVMEEEIVIEKGGSFSVSFEVPQQKEDYVIMLELFPHLQSEKIRKILGHKGEKLYSSSQVAGIYHYIIDDTLHTGVRLYGEADREYMNESKKMFGSLKSSIPTVRGN